MFRKKLNYHLNGEKTLWRAKPRTAEVVFARWSFPRNILYKMSIAILICSIYMLAMAILFYGAFLTSQSFDQWFSYACFTSIAGFAALLLVIMFPISPIAMNAVQYEISNQRIIWWSKQGTCYMFLDNVIQATLRLDGAHEVLEWHGNVTEKRFDLIGKEVEEIVFVGHDFLLLKDAASIIKLVENERGIIIPIEDRRYEAKIKEV